MSKPLTATKKGMLDSGNSVFFMNKITQSGETITACPLTHELATGTLQFSPFGL